jgi:hypothetical protein
MKETRMSNDQQPKDDLNITSQGLQISSEPQVDPEGQTVVREFKGTAPADMRGAPTINAAVTGHVGELPLVLQYSGKAGEMANAARTACVGCKHWDNRALKSFVANAEGPASSAESRQTVQSMRERIKRAGYGFKNKLGFHDVEATLHAHGICRVLSDWIESCVGRDPMFWPAISWREASCPNICRAGPHELNVVTPAEPFGLFSPVDSEATKVGAGRYDAILKTVQEQNKR